MSCTNLQMFRLLLFAWMSGGLFFPQQNGVVVVSLTPRRPTFVPIVEKWELWSATLKNVLMDSASATRWSGFTRGKLWVVVVVVVLRWLCFVSLSVYCVILCGWVQAHDWKCFSAFTSKHWIPSSKLSFESSRARICFPEHQHYHGNKP